MTNSGVYNNIDEPVAEAQNSETDDTAVTESGKIDGGNSNEIFSDSAPGVESSAADNDSDDGKEGGGKKITNN